MSARLSFKIINLLHIAKTDAISPMKLDYGLHRSRRRNVTKFCEFRDAFFELNVGTECDPVQRYAVCSDYNLNGLRAVNSITFNGFNSFRFTYANVMFFTIQSQQHTHTYPEHWMCVLWFRSTCIRSVYSQSVAHILQLLLRDDLYFQNSLCTVKNVAIFFFFLPLHVHSNNKSHIK